MTGRDRTEPVLVSSCLLGAKVRYDGSDRLSGHPILERWQREGRVVPICPELAAGFPTPRPPAEIVGADGGEEVIGGRGAVVELGGADVTALYRSAGEIALDLALRTGCRFALLTDGSPSCGSRFIYDGTFTGRRIAGRGTTAAMLERHGIRVFSEGEIGDLDDLLGPCAEG